jgi:hypothetical protein
MPKPVSAAVANVRRLLARALGVDDEESELPRDALTHYAVPPRVETR